MMKLVIFDWGRTLYNPEEEALYQDTKPTLEYLQSKGFKMAIVSLATKGSAKIEERRRIIKQEGLEQYFESILFNVADKASMYQATLQELKVKPSEVTIVDDRMIRGIKWGNSSGCDTIWIQQGRFANELPDELTGLPKHTISSIGELRSIL